MKAVSRSHGPSERLTVDLSDLDQSSTLNLVTGEAGNFLSPYYMDQWKAWYEGYSFTLPIRERRFGPCSSMSWCWRNKLLASSS